MSRTQIEKLLGQPTFVERELGDMFVPPDSSCREMSRASFIYQGMPEETLVVFFDDESRVTCFETTTAFMIMHRID